MTNKEISPKQKEFLIWVRDVKGSLYSYKTINILESVIYTHQYGHKAEELLNGIRDRFGASYKESLKKYKNRKSNR